ncbi:MAG: ATP-grasp domain-containing protein [Treponema sp.]|nr:ATP-grasp domain-containing protein [Candidatus Treponema caballi]
MKVVFYSSSTNAYDGSSFHYTAYPACCSQLEKLAAAHPEHEFVVVARLPAFFLVDLENDGSFIRKARGVEYVMLDAAGLPVRAMLDKQADAAFKACAPASASQASSAKKALFADNAATAISALSPDIAVAATCWMTPFDWLPLEDALIAEKLEKAGIRTLCHSAASVELCFDKRETRAFLKAHRFPAPESVFLDHELYRAERSHADVVINPYKERMFTQLEKLHYPCVIKDTTGLSSFGMDVVNSPEAVRAVLDSRKMNGDRLIEEFVEGDQFGVEVYGTPGHYQVMTPFLFSVTRHGITSPKQSVKLSVSGDEAETRFKLADMRRLVTDMAEALELRGAAQFDLVFSGAPGLESECGPSCEYGSWVVIEVNPRLSGLTVPTAVLAGKSAPDLLLVAGLESVSVPSCENVLSDAAAPNESEMRCDGAASPETSGVRCDGAASPETRGVCFEGSQSRDKSGVRFEDRTAPAYVLDVKLIVLAGERFEELCALPYVYAVNQTANDDARQMRERGYCEVVLGAETPAVLLARLNDLKALFPDELDDNFVESARHLVLKAY